MKKVFIAIVLILVSTLSFANLEVYFMYASFNSPEGPYIETYLSTIGKSAVFVKNENQKFQAEIEITMIFKTNDKVVSVNKYNLSSPEIDDTAGSKPNFIDLQRVSLPNGMYNFEMLIKDVNSQQEAYKFADIIQIDYSSNTIQFSGIQLIESITPTENVTALTKNGYDLLPYISNFYPQNFNKISFYTEIYNTDKLIQGEFLVRYYIESFETYKEFEEYSRFKKLSSAEIIPFIGEINIESLASGNYNLVVEVKNRDNVSLQKTKFFFQRSNTTENDLTALNEMIKEYDITTSFAGDMKNKDSVFLYVSCLRPIADMNEQKFIDYQAKYASLEELQNYFLQFWLTRNNVNPGEIWKQYKDQVEFVDRNYRTPINRGFETDRGRVYLQYGVPNDIYVSKHEPSAYPYEIWHYYRVRNENNKKFIFYNPNIAGKEYELLHSDLTGEIKTPNWERMLSKRNTTLYNQDAMQSDETWGSRALEEYNK
ncbi:MAG TPA: GWxTD domain-containing protein [Bacteroidales bacterium]|nr:GWxTD domain-containing protein [Bacteroidales bacterium]